MPISTGGQDLCLENKRVCANNVVAPLFICFLHEPISLVCARKSLELLMLRFICVLACVCLGVHSMDV